MMLQQTTECPTCRGTIGPHWQMFDHATCRPPLLEQVVRAIPAPPGEEGAASMRWCKGCQQYHLGPHTPQLGRHLRRALTRISRDW
jgi:hypothetical protein